MTVRLINLSSINQSNVSAGPQIKRTKWGSVFVIGKSQDGFLNLFFTESGTVFNVQEVIDQYGLNSKEYSHICAKILNSKERIFMATAACCDLTGQFTLSKATVAQICKQTTKPAKYVKPNSFNSVFVPLESIYCKLFLKLKESFLQHSSFAMKAA